MASILDQLLKGDLRTIGNSNAVVKKVLKEPSLFKELFPCLFSKDPGMRMRSADALEKISLEKPELLQPYKKLLLGKVSMINQQEVQWHLAQMFSYLELTPSEEKKVVQILFQFLDTTNSSIVRVFSIQTLADIAERNNGLSKKILKRIKDEVRVGSPAVVTRGKKALGQLKIYG
ncbi:MAG: hypothetical protein WCJ19_04955 [bacterium]